MQFVIDSFEDVFQAYFAAKKILKFDKIRFFYGDQDITDTTSSVSFYKMDSDSVILASSCEQEEHPHDELWSALETIRDLQQKLEKVEKESKALIETLLEGKCQEKEEELSSSKIASVAKKNECLICLEGNVDMMSLCCGCCMHFFCLKRWKEKNKKCPQCNC